VPTLVQVLEDDPEAAGVDRCGWPKSVHDVHPLYRSGVETCDLVSDAARSVNGQFPKISRRLRCTRG
jgi:hypothetical protein